MRQQGGVHCSHKRWLERNKLISNGPLSLDVAASNKIVSLVKCDHYERQSVLKGVGAAIDLLGGLDTLVSPGQRIVVKPNLLRASDVERHVTTHPEVVHAICRLLADRRCEILIADSPGGGTPYTERALKKSYQSAKLDEVAADTGARLNFDLSSRNVPAPNGKLIKRFDIIKPVLDADAVINACKLKTHLFTYITGATKNTFGVIPGIEKATFHSRLPRPDDFSEMLIDLNELVGPKLHIMDAVVAMEGNGSNAGKARKVGAILASENYAALDAVACRLVSISPSDVGVIKAAVGRGILRGDLSDVKIVGEDIEDIIIRDFKKPKSYLRPSCSQSAVWRALGRMSRAYALRPRVMRRKCRGTDECGECLRACPRRAISSRGDSPAIDYAKCIRCYCCHEICPNAAISLERSAGGKVIKGIVDRRSRSS